ncbi:unnamed protein product [Darwinula stevensoni]|uniref:Uncharacterized protein n=1 Tax=Darwinula stevensoni TaxID=69355 RepID=A0A7R8X9R7_9CRUS|nr:unnamed protein product [Darwinula stevensoni]CAG0889901.1 unnamed protein product [Darwinula stevensoni]
MKKNMSLAFIMALLVVINGGTDTDEKRDSQQSREPAKPEQRGIEQSNETAMPSGTANDTTKRDCQPDCQPSKEPTGSEQKEMKEKLPCIEGNAVIAGGAVNDTAEERDSQPSREQAEPERKEKSEMNACMKENEGALADPPPGPVPTETLIEVCTFPPPDCLRECGLVTCNLANFCDCSTFWRCRYGFIRRIRRRWGLLVSGPGVVLDRFLSGSHSTDVYDPNASTRTAVEDERLGPVEDA